MLRALRRRATGALRAAWRKASRNEVEQEATEATKRQVLLNISSSRPSRSSVDFIALHRPNSVSHVTFPISETDFQPPRARFTIAAHGSFSARGDGKHARFTEKNQFARHLAFRSLARDETVHMFIIRQVAQFRSPKTTFFANFFQTSRRVGTANRVRDRVQDAVVGNAHPTSLGGLCLRSAFWTF